MPPKKSSTITATPEQLDEVHRTASQAFQPKFLIESLGIIWRKLSLGSICALEDITNHLQISSYITRNKGKVIVHIVPKILQHTAVTKALLKRLDNTIQEMYDKKVAGLNKQFIILNIQRTIVVSECAELSTFSHASGSQEDSEHDKQKITDLIKTYSQDKLRKFLQIVRKEQSEVSILITLYLYSEISNHLKISDLRPASINELQKIIHEDHDAKQKHLRSTITNMRDFDQQLSQIFVNLSGYDVDHTLNEYLLSFNLKIQTYRDLSTISKEISKNLVVLQDFQDNIIPTHIEINQSFCNIYLKLKDLIDCNFKVTYLPGLGSGPLTKENLTRIYQTSSESFNLDQWKQIVSSSITNMQKLDTFCQHCLKTLYPEYQRLLFAESISKLGTEESTDRSRIEEHCSKGFNSLLSNSKIIPSANTTLVTHFQPVGVAKTTRTKTSVSHAIRQEQLEQASDDQSNESDTQTVLDTFRLNLNIENTEYELASAVNLYKIGSTQNMYIADLGTGNSEELKRFAERGFITAKSRAKHGFKQHYPEWIALKQGDANRQIWVKYDIQGRNVYLRYETLSHNDYERLINQHSNNQTQRSLYLRRALESLNVQETPQVVGTPSRTIALR